MSYIALYRKFRPGDFNDVKGQNHITTTLKNQMIAERIGHAYLFCGTRGTGKTTVAKIFAKAVNCEHPIDGNPCGECSMCKEIASGASMNVIEIDAASNNGVDNIRQLQEGIEYRPANGKYKVYIIDEVHMLSAGAFNAMLKTLEEPPEYAIFILATTELHKIPITILSRCQHYDFKRITIDVIVDRLRELTQKEQIDVEEKALRYIAKVADGSMRDALSILDQCTAFYLGQTLTYDNTLEVLGAVDTETFSHLLRAVLVRDVVNVLELVDELIMQGREITQLVNDFAWYLRNLLLIKSADNMENVIDVSAENLALLKEEAEMVESMTLLRYIRIFSELSNQMRQATQKRILLEIALIKLCEPQMEVDQESVLERVRKIEDTLEHGMPVQVVTGQQGARRAAQEVEPVISQPLDMALPDEIEQVKKNFRMITSACGSIIKQYLHGAEIGVAENGRLLIMLKDEMAVAYINREECKEEIQKVIEDKIQKQIEIEVRSIEDSRNHNSTSVAFTGLLGDMIQVEE